MRRKRRPANRVDRRVATPDDADIARRRDSRCDLRFVAILDHGTSPLNRIRRMAQRALKQATEDLLLRRSACRETHPVPIAGERCQQPGVKKNGIDIRWRYMKYQAPRDVQEI